MEPLAKIKSAHWIVATMAHVPYRMVPTNSTVLCSAIVMLVLVVYLVDLLNVIATVTMVNVFSMPISLRNHVFVQLDGQVPIVKQVPPRALLPVPPQAQLRVPLQPPLKVSSLKNAISTSE